MHEDLEAKMKALGLERELELARKYLAQWLEQQRRQEFEEGRAEGLRYAAPLICELLGIEWTDERKQAIAELDATQLDVLYDILQHDRRWPD